MNWKQNNEDPKRRSPTCEAADAESFRQNSKVSSIIIYRNIDFEEDEVQPKTKTPTKSPIRICLGDTSESEGDDQDPAEDITVIYDDNEDTPLKLKKQGGARQLDNSSEDEEEPVIMPPAEEGDDSWESVEEETCNLKASGQRTPKPKRLQKDQAMSPKDSTPLHSRLETMLMSTPTTVDRGVHAGAKGAPAPSRKLFGVSGSIFF